MIKKNFLLSIIALSVILLNGCCTLRLLTINASVGGSTITDSPSWKFGLAGSAGAGICLAQINESMVLSGEANLSLQGARWEDYGYSGRTNLLYFNVPVLLRYQTKSGFFGEAGIQPGLLLSAKDKYEGHSDNYMDHMNKLDLSIPFGAGYMFNENLGVSLRVTPGINDISKDTDDKDRNLVIGLRGIYRFGKK